TKTNSKRMESPVMINKYIVLSIILPFCYAAILMPPKRVFPVVSDFCHFSDMVFIDFQSETRAFGDFHIAIFIFKNILVHNVIKQVTPLVIMYPKTLFLDKGIVAGGIHLETGSQCYWSQGTMRCHGHVKGFRHRKYFLAFCNP